MLLSEQGCISKCRGEDFTLIVAEKVVPAFKIHIFATKLAKYDKT